MLVFGWRAEVKGGGRGVAHPMASSGYLHFTWSRWSDVTLLSTVRRVACYCIQSTVQYNLVLHAFLDSPEALQLFFAPADMTATITCTFQTHMNAKVVSSLIDRFLL
jgi:hypothetical protein